MYRAGGEAAERSGGGVAEAAAPATFSGAAAMTKSALPIFGLKLAVRRTTPTGNMLRQQSLSHPVPADFWDIGQSAPILLLAMPQSGAQGLLVVVPIEQVKPARAGCAAKRASTRVAASWRDLFIRCTENMTVSMVSICEPNHKSTRAVRLGRGLKRGCGAYFAVSAATGTSMSSLRITRLVAFRVASSKPWPWVMASVGQASTQ
jgi:hypothetical protein